jgi:hypothetical protein
MVEWVGGDFVGRGFFRRFGGRAHDLEDLFF